ncbi:putative sporulation protein YtxC [Clostridium polynesiense]|uniref:putative sporulation protein YtxC n=1 Tax=Clostridium polynesiense TaxID=1325933 RepID=UPI000590A81D|nr:putative sporulation protein YtxC [Clostridium polynesiense]
MMLLKLAYEGEMNLIEDIQNMRQNFKTKNIILGISESIEGNTHFIKILCEDNDYSDNLQKMVYLYISNILYKIIVDYFRKREMYEVLTDTYFFLKHDEILNIEDKSMKVLMGEISTMDETYVFCMNRINSIIEKIKCCIEEKKEININGFITFRMKDLIYDLESVVDKIVEKYMIEKEYNEFIKLLKYFVDIQESKILEVNIIIDIAGNYKIQDTYGNDIFHDFVSDLTEGKFSGIANIEDIIISGLITNSPRKIIIHGKDNCKNIEVLETIKNVFTDRVTFCSKCKYCCTHEIKI